MDSHSLARVRCRQIQDQDLDSVADLLTEGFADRPRNYWTSGWESLRQRPTPQGFPRFGYVLESENALVGVLLLIYTGGGEAGSPYRFNVSSWYVREAFRAHASLLVAMALRRKDVVYLNASPRDVTLPILEAQGFTRLTSGQFLCMPLLSLRGLRARITKIGPDTGIKDYPDQAELDLLRAHAEHGCLSLVCRDARGWAPLMFLRRDIRYSPAPVLQLGYCRDTGDLARFANAVGRFLLASGHGLVLCDANGAAPGLAGMFFRGRAPKYYRGPVAPRINDLAFSEAVVFGP